MLLAFRLGPSDQDTHTLRLVWNGGWAAVLAVASPVGLPLTITG